MSSIYANRLAQRASGKWKNRRQQQHKSNSAGAHLLAVIPAVRRKCSLVFHGSRLFRDAAFRGLRPRRPSARTSRMLYHVKGSNDLTECSC